MADWIYTGIGYSVEPVVFQDAPAVTNSEHTTAGRSVEITSNMPVNFPELSPIQSTSSVARTRL